MRYACLFLLCALSLAGCATTSSHPNFGASKAQLYAYKTSGAYDRDVAATDAAAEAYIVSRAGKVRKPAIVLDIDETSLSNWAELQANDFVFRPSGPCDHLPQGPCGHSAWQHKARAAAIMPAVHLFRTARAHNVAVFFITGRDETMRAATVENLHRAGYHGWTALILRPAGTKTRSAADYKAPQRAKIEAQGYTIIANIGDQPSDLAGGHAEKSFLVPDPFYQVP